MIVAASTEISNFPIIGDGGGIISQDNRCIKRLKRKLVADYYKSLSDFNNNDPHGQM